ncbi:hypothetical protein CR513_40274, partial [Mucuna pruriens]
MDEKSIVKCISNTLVTQTPYKPSSLCCSREIMSPTSVGFVQQKFPHLVGSKTLILTIWLLLGIRMIPPNASLLLPPRNNHGLLLHRESRTNQDRLQPNDRTLLPADHDSEPKEPNLLQTLRSASAKIDAWHIKETKSLKEASNSCR